MESCVFSMMQRAVDIVLTSPHPTNKIAATLAGKSAAGDDFCISSTNSWPDSILKAIGEGEKIGNSSGTIHAETECILKAPATKGASLFVTDPPCPNCVKNMAEAGIRKLYIDHKGFEKDFALRRGEDFLNISLPLCREAGIDVYKINRKDKTRELLQKGKRGAAKALHQDGCFITPLPASAGLMGFVKNSQTLFPRQPFAAALGRRRDETLGITAAPLTFQSFPAADTHGKYSPVMEPLGRLLITAQREGITLLPQALYSSRIPTSRELVNMVGAGHTALHIGDMNSARDIFGPQALKRLTEKKIITVIVEH